ncbi:MAG TPA: DivIVA domain-containing protein [Acidimicrobiales bacterium]|jgi:DivIVA domain-containing protein
MPLTPEDIERRQFTVTLRGYHTAEVDAFLRHIAAELREQLALPGLPSLPPAPDGAPVVRADMGVGPAFGRVAHTIASLLQTAAESAADIRRDAEEEAAATRAKAAEEARALRERVDREAAETTAATQAERQRAEQEAAEARARAGAEVDRARADAARILESARREAAELRSRAQADHDRLVAIDRDLRGRLEQTAENLLRSLHRPVVQDPVSMPVLSLPDEERRVVEPPVAEWADG